MAKNHGAARADEPSRRRDSLLDERHIGKPLVTSDDVPVGKVVGASDDGLLVKPHPRLLDGYGSWLCCVWDRCPHFILDHDAVIDVQRDRIVIAGSIGR